MKKIRCLLPLLLLALFTGCTLMIDEPETATTPQETENGDGITSPRRTTSYASRQGRMARMVKWTSMAC